MKRQIQRCSGQMLRRFRQLTRKKARVAEQRFLVEGIRTVRELLASDWEVEALLVHDVTILEQFEDLLARKPAPCYQTRASDLDLLSDTVTSQGVVCVVRMKQFPGPEIFTAKEGPILIVALEGVADPGNVGTIIRTCDWFGADAVLLDETTVELFNSKVIRSAMGSVFHLPVYGDVVLRSLLQSSKEHRITVVTTTLRNGKPPGGTRFPDRCLLVFGSEAHGVSSSTDALADERITISRSGRAESLNVAIACGILLEKIRGGDPHD